MCGDDERGDLGAGSQQSAGGEVEVTDARKVKGLAPSACKTDKVDARVLAELCRCDLVPVVWLPSLEDRALRERLERRPWHQLYRETAKRQGKTNAGMAAVARRVLITAWVSLDRLAGLLREPTPSA